MANKRVYIAGPMTGLPDFNYPAFEAAAARLSARGFEPVSPTENGKDEEPGAHSWEWYMRLAIAQLVSCDAAYFLRGWAYSRGARVEHYLADVLRLRKFYEEYEPLKEPAL